MNNTTTALFDAVRDNAVTAARIKKLVNDGADIASTNEHFSPLQLAVKNKAGTDVIQTLLAAGADVNACLRIGDIPAGAAADKYCEQMHAPLHIATMRKDEDAADAVKVLCEAGADVNMHSDDHGNVPLHYVHVKAVAEQLIQHGADVNAENAGRDTPPVSALRDNDTEADCVKVLLRAGAGISSAQCNDKRSVRNYVEEYLEKHPDVEGQELLALAGRACSDTEEYMQQTTGDAVSDHAGETPFPWKKMLSLVLTVIVFSFKACWWLFRLFSLPFLVILGILTWMAPGFAAIGSFTDRSVNTAADQEKASRRSGAVFRFAGKVFRNLFGLK